MSLPHVANPTVHNLEQRIRELDILLAKANEKIAELTANIKAKQSDQEE